MPARTRCRHARYHLVWVGQPQKPIRRQPVNRIKTFVIAALILLASLTAVAKPKPKAPQKERTFVGAKVQRSIDREGRDRQQGPGALLHIKKKGTTTTSTWLADCEETTICLLSIGPCYFDHDWVAFAPDTVGEALWLTACAGED